MQDRGKYSDPKPTSRGTSLLVQDQLAWDRACFEAQILDDLCRGQRSRSATTEAAAVLGWSISKVYYKLKRYEASGHVGSLLKQHRSLRTAKSRLSPKQDALIDKVLRRFLRHHKDTPIQFFVDEAVEALKDAGLPLPHQRTIRRRYERLSARQRHAHKHGAEHAADKHNLQLGSTPKCTYPLERVQIDHTPADVWLVSEDASTPLGRPVVTLVIDDFSRLVLAINITFSDPSVINLAETIALTCMPKRSWLDEIGLQSTEWPHSGIFTTLYVDRGVDFTSSALEFGCRKHRINLIHRNRCHHGGIIENRIGHAMRRTRLLPGNTTMSTARKRGDKIDPSKSARLTLSQYRAELVRYFTCEYPFEEHPSLGMAPADKWNLGVHQNGPVKQVRDPQTFYLDFLQPEERTLQQYGLRWKYQDYRSRELQPLLNLAKGVEVIVKIDPGDVSRAFVMDPRDGSYIELSSDLTAGKGITREEWSRANEKLKENAPNTKVTGEKILHYVLTGRRLNEEATFHGVAAPRPVGAQKGRRKMVKAEEVAAERRATSARRLPSPENAQVHFTLTPLPNRTSVPAEAITL